MDSTPNAWYAPTLSIKSESMSSTDAKRYLDQFIKIRDDHLNSPDKSTPLGRKIIDFCNQFELHSS